MAAAARPPWKRCGRQPRWGGVAPARPQQRETLLHIIHAGAEKGPISALLGRKARGNIDALLPPELKTNRGRDMMYPTENFHADSCGTAFFAFERDVRCLH